MRIVAGIVVAIGPGIALVGQLAVFVQYDDLERQVSASQDVNAIRDAQQTLSMWPVMSLGVAITTVGFLLRLLGGSIQRRHRRYGAIPDEAPRARPRPSHGDADALWRRRKAS